MLTTDTACVEDSSCNKDKKTAKILLTALNAKYIHSNLAVYCLQAYAEKQGFHADIAEYTINQQFEVILRKIYEQNPDVLCFSCYIWNIEYVKDITAEFHKLRPDVPIWLGGPEVSFDSEDFLLSNPQITGIIVGEGERVFSRICRFYQGKNSEMNLRDIPGIVWREADGDICQSQPAEIVKIDDIPFCYNNLDKFDNRIIYYESSRGCPFSCSYCLSSVDKRLRFRSLPLVYRELQYFLDNDVPQVKFVDRTFNCNHEHALGIWRYIKDHDNNITNFHFEISADLINEEELSVLAQMRPGLVQLEIGIQSTNPAALKEIHRTMNFDRLKEVVSAIKKGKNIHQHVDLIAGLPEEGYESFKNSFDEVYRLKTQQLQLGFLKVLKGSYMYDMADKYHILYRNRPPYEVLGTDWISYEELQKTKLVCDMVEMHYNSGQFLRTLAVLENIYDSPFEMFLELGEYYVDNGLYDVSHTRMTRADILYRFAITKDCVRAELYGEALLYDLCVRENIKIRPKWASERDKHGIDVRRTIQSLGYEKKYCHMEPFHFPVYDIDTGLGATRLEKSDKPQWILFDYEHRSVMNREAGVIKIHKPVPDGFVNQG